MKGQRFCRIGSHDSRISIYMMMALDREGQILPEFNGAGRKS
jgi:hypothetical protein